MHKPTLVANEARKKREKEENLLNQDTEIAVQHFEDVAHLKQLLKKAKEKVSKVTTPVEIMKQKPSPFEGL